MAQPSTRRRFAARLNLLSLEDRALPSISALDGLRVARHLSAVPAAATSVNSGFTPAQVRQAYGIDSLTADGTGQTIAIISAYHNANIQADLDVFAAAYGLRGTTVTTINLGGDHADAGWALETALDVQWAHAVAPNANIVLIESASDRLADMLAAVDAARNTHGVSVVSMSWGAYEFPNEAAYDSYFTTPAGHAPVAFVAASGDDSAHAGVMWPAASPNVLSVGGTSLRIGQGGASFGESAWGYGGGGVSRYESQPDYQLSVQATGRRTVPDVSYNANPSTGFAVYSSVTSAGLSGWLKVGGTSAGAPQWAGLIVLANQMRAARGEAGVANAAAAVYSLSVESFRDITTGDNGYRATSGYDLATGRGSPVAEKVVTSLAGRSVASTTTRSVAPAGTGVRVRRSIATTTVSAPLAPSIAAAQSVSLAPITGSTAVVVQALAPIAVTRLPVPALPTVQMRVAVSDLRVTGSALAPVVAAPPAPLRAYRDSGSHGGDDLPAIGVPPARGAEFVAATVPPPSEPNGPEPAAEMATANASLAAAAADEQAVRGWRWWEMGLLVAASGLVAWLGTSSRLRRRLRAAGARIGGRAAMSWTGRPE